MRADTACTTPSLVLSMPASCSAAMLNSINIKPMCRTIVWLLSFSPVHSYHAGAHIAASTSTAITLWHLAHDAVHDARDKVGLLDAVFGAHVVVIENGAQRADFQRSKLGGGARHVHALSDTCKGSWCKGRESMLNQCT